MPDPFTNARPYYDVTFPTSGDSFSISNTRNALQGLGFLDMIPLQPRAHSPGDLRIMVRGRDASSYYNPIYAGDADKHLFFSSGDSATMSAPSSNPRLDIVYLTASGDIRIVTGAEAATPTLPSLSPSGDTRIPICAIYHKVGEAKIVNFEDKDSNSGDGYIYQDLRPFLRAAGLGGVSLTATTPAGVTGDNVVGTGTTAARPDHTHQGVHAVRKVGSANLLGDVEFAGQDITQGGNRLTWSGMSVKMWINFDGSTTPPTINSSFNVASITDNGVGDFTINFQNNFADANYCLVGMVKAVQKGVSINGTGGLAVGSARIIVYDTTNGGAFDATQICVMAVAL